MFRVTVFLGLACSILLLVLVLRPTEEDRAAYRALVAKSQALEQDASPLSYCGTQKRSGVEKNVWYLSEPESPRLHLRITSAVSTLYFLPAVVEKLEKVSLAMQEELFYKLPNGKEVIEKGSGKWLLRGYDPDRESSWLSVLPATAEPMQTLRYMTADHAVYRYDAEELTAEDVAIRILHAKGHALADVLNILDTIPAQFNGHAKLATVKLKGDKPVLTAQKFTATLAEVQSLQ